jgi:hypothetical protein
MRNMQHAARIVPLALLCLLLWTGVLGAQAPEADVASTPNTPDAMDVECADLCERSYREVLDDPVKAELKACEATQSCLVRLRDDPRYGWTAHFPAEDLLDRLLDPLAIPDQSYDG